MKIIHYFSVKFRHWFHVISNVRPIVWISLYILCMPLFAVVYDIMPDSQFRIPDGAGTDYGSWLYYSIVTITTLGFGDYTPAHGMAQAVTAIEVMTGLVVLGFFLNAVGSMKSEIDIESEMEKQRMLHEAQEKEKLAKTAPSIIHNINLFLTYCYAVTTPIGKRGERHDFDKEFTLADMADMFKPSHLADDHSRMPAVERLLKCASRTSLYLDGLQTRIDLSLWPELLEDIFSFVARYQLFSSTDILTGGADKIIESDEKDPAKAEAKVSKAISDSVGPDDARKDPYLEPVLELYHFIKEDSELALKIEAAITKIASA